jgi:hypothetical protein
MGERRIPGFWWRNLRDRDHLEDLGVDVRIIIRLVFRNWVVYAWTEFRWLRIERAGEHL